jgi:hypothetical protein
MQHLLENSFRDLVYKEQDIELYEYHKAIKILEAYEAGIISEGVFGDLLDKVSGEIKKKIGFIKEIAEKTGNKLKDLLVLFKDSKFFEIFKTIGFSIKKLGAMLKKGIDTYNSIHGILAEKIHAMGGVQYIKKNLHKLDEFFKEHPVLKKIGGVAVAGLLLYIWLNMSVTPLLKYSMNFEDLIMALRGNFSLAELFASPSGIIMLIYLATGIVAGVSMPWAGGPLTQIVRMMLFSTWKLLNVKKVKIEKPSPLKLGKYPKVSF